MNRGLNTRLRRLERNAPDPVQAALDALSDEDLGAAIAALRVAETGADLDMSTLPEAVQRFFETWAERSSHGSRAQGRRAGSPTVEERPELDGRLHGYHGRRPRACNARPSPTRGPDRPRRIPVPPGARPPA